MTPIWLRAVKSSVVLVACFSVAVVHKVFSYIHIHIGSENKKERVSTSDFFIVDSLKVTWVEKKFIQAPRP